MVDFKIAGSLDQEQSAAAFNTRRSFRSVRVAAARDGPDVRWLVQQLWQQRVKVHECDWQDLTLTIDGAQTVEERAGVQAVESRIGQGENSRWPRSCGVDLGRL